MDSKNGGVLAHERANRGGLLAADGCKTGFEVGEDVVDVLGADGQADGVLVDLLLGQFSVVQLAVGGGSRVDDQALYVATLASREKIFRLSMNLKASSRPPLI